MYARHFRSIVGIHRRFESNVFCHRGHEHPRLATVLRAKLSIPGETMTHARMPEKGTASAQSASWRAVLLDYSIVVDDERSVSDDYRCRVVSRRLGIIDFAIVTGDAVEMNQDPSYTDRGGRGTTNVALQLSGECSLTQRDRTATLRPGDFAVYETDAFYRLTFDEPFEHLIVRLPTEFTNMAGTPGKVAACLMSGTRGVSGLASSVLRGIAERIDEELPDSQQLATGLLNLIAAAVAERRDQIPGNSFGTLGEALILDVKAFIDAHLDDPELSSAAIARAHSISPRYLQKLFENQGTTATEWVRSRRLERCRADLVSAEHDSTSIAAIAARWGLVDSSYFSRMFKAAYGVSPREYRTQAGAEMADETERVASSASSGVLS